MNVLITGGAGFIGSALTQHLAAAGHRVAVVDNGSTAVLRTTVLRTVLRHTAAPRSAALHGAALHETALHEADIAAPGLDDVFAEVRPEAVIHLAARANVTESMHDPVGGAAVNVCGTVNALRQSLAFGVRRFVFASTGGALYGDSPPRPTPETAPPAPLCPYGASKAAGEVYVRAMSRHGAMRYTILRLGNVYGPGTIAGGEPGVIAAFARAMLGGARPVIYGDGLAERDFVHVEDVVHAHALALDLRGEGVFNIATGTSRTVRQVFDAVARATGYRREPVYARARPGELHSCRLQVSLARHELRWWPRVAFEHGIAQTVRCMRAQAAGSASAALG